MSKKTNVKKQCRTLSCKLLAINSACYIRLGFAVEMALNWNDARLNEHKGELMPKFAFSHAKRSQPKYLLTVWLLNMPWTLLAIERTIRRKFVWCANPN